MKNLVKLGELTTIKTGKLDANASTPNGAYPFFTCAVKPLKISSYSYDCECVLVAGNGDLNVKYYCGKFDAYQRTYIIEVKDKEKLLTKYLYNFLQLYISILRSQSIGGVIKYIKLNNLTDLQINVPPLSEQQKIISIIEQISTLTAKRNQQLEKIDSIVQAKFYEMFGDLKNNNTFCGKFVPLSEIADYYSGLTYKPENITENGVIVLRSSNIKNGELDLKDIVRVNCPIREKLYVREGDILMCSRNGSAKLVGKVAEISKLQEPATFGAFMMIIRSKYNKFLLTYFELPVFREQIKAGTTTTINQITSSMLDKIYLPLPPQPLIETFAYFVEQTEKIKSKIKLSLEKLELLKQSLLQKYFG